MTDISATIEHGSMDDGATESRWLPRLAAVLAVGAVVLAIGILRLGTSGDIRFRLGLDITSIAPVMTTLLSRSSARLSSSGDPPPASRG
jgi:hypothetical protein